MTTLTSDPRADKVAKGNAGNSRGSGVAGPSYATREKLRALVRRRFDRSIEAPRVFFDTDAGEVSAATLAMARRFHQGGRLFVFGVGAEATDAQHVSVEFVHPVIVGKRALPAIALTNDVATFSATPPDSEQTHAFARMLATLGRSEDIALGLCGSRESIAVTETLDRGRTTGMLTIAVTSYADSRASLNRFDHVFVINENDPLAAQEVSETLYHVLWELVHVFLDHMPGQTGEGKT